MQSPFCTVGVGGGRGPEPQENQKSKTRVSLQRVLALQKGEKGGSQPHLKGPRLQTFWHPRSQGGGFYVQRFSVCVKRQLVFLWGLERATREPKKKKTKHLPACLQVFCILGERVLGASLGLGNWRKYRCLESSVLQNVRCSWFSIMIFPTALYTVFTTMTICTVKLLYQSWHAC